MAIFLGRNQLDDQSRVNADLAHLCERSSLISRNKGVESGDGFAFARIFRAATIQSKVATSV
jgi:hypothetical protein